MNFTPQPSLCREGVDQNSTLFIFVFAKKCFYLLALLTVDELYAGSTNSHSRSVSTTVATVTSTTAAFLFKEHEVLQGKEKNCMGTVQKVIENLLST